MGSFFFPSLFDRPDGIRYGEQEPNEIIELMLRRHWITNIPWILTALFLFALPAVVSFIDQTFNFHFFSQVPTSLILGVLVLWYLLVLGYVIEQFLYWYYNIYLVTNFHIIDINFFSLLYRNVTESELTDIQSINSKIAGIIASLFNFGDVLIETAAKGQLIEFLDVPKPDFVADRIEELRGVPPPSP